MSSELKVQLNELELRSCAKCNFTYTPVLNSKGHTVYKSTSSNGKIWYSLGNDTTGSIVSEFYGSDPTKGEKHNAEFLLNEHLRDLEFFNAYASVVVNECLPPAKTRKRVTRKATPAKKVTTILKTKQATAKARVTRKANTKKPTLKR